MIMKTFYLFIFIFTSVQFSNGQCTYTTTVTNASCFNSCSQGSITYFVSGGIPPYQISSPLGTFSFNNSWLDSACAGTYSFTITDQGGCNINGSVNVSVNGPTVNSYSGAASCSTCADGIVLLTVSGNGPFEIHDQSNTNDTGVFYNDLIPGYHSFWIEDSIHCVAIENIVTGVNNGSVNEIEGEVYLDMNTNGVKDTGEPGLISGVNISPLNTAVCPDVTGHFQLRLPQTTYSVSPQIHSGWYLTSTPGSYTFTLAGSDVSNLDFGLYTVNPFYEIETNLSSSLPRCSTDVMHDISVINTGTIGIDSIAVVLTIDPLMTFVSSIPSPAMQFGNNVVWGIPIIQPFQTIHINPILHMPGHMIAVTSSVAIYGYDSQSNLIYTANDTLEQIVRCSFDPNDISVNPVGETAAHLILPSQSLEYKIRFQNTGNDTAFNVHILNLLDPSLDPATFEVIASSHSVQTTLDTNSLVNFQFDNILLPDSNVDEASSHGYVIYRIRAKNNIQDPTEINNNAFIFFDQNAAVQTNTVFNTLSNNFPTAVVEIKSVPAAKIFPNPAVDEIKIQFSNDDLVSELVSLCDITGKNILNIKRNGKNTVTVPVADIYRGVYLLFINTADYKRINSQIVILN
jgi:uncharacterized repeat protein (TIGR01451 family)